MNKIKINNTFKNAYLTGGHLVKNLRRMLNSACLPVGMAATRAALINLLSRA